MSYKLKFLPSALKEWRKLDDNIRGQLKKKLAERLNAPNVPSARLRGYADIRIIIR
jgi:mRNA interferase RelE/StbE